MADAEQLAILRGGVDGWNRWRLDHKGTSVDLAGADLAGADLEEANLDRADLTGAVLKGANLTEARLLKANLNGAILTGARLMGAYLKHATLRNADCGKANLNGANLNRADLSGATFANADLSFVRMIGTSLHGAKLNGCRVYGLSAWDVETDDDTEQSSLIITPSDRPAIMVDNLKVAQFLYLIINNKEIRDVIDTITSKVVLILGRFTPERKAVLDALRVALGEQKDAAGNQRYIPVMFDFDKPESQNYLEPVVTLAHLARFVIADVTDPRIVLEELPAIVNAASVPIQPLLLWKEVEPVTLGNLRVNRLSILKTYRYRDQDGLLAALAAHVVGPAEARLARLQKRIRALSKPVLPKKALPQPVPQPIPSPKEPLP